MMTKTEELGIDEKFIDSIVDEVLRSKDLGVQEISEGYVSDPNLKKEISKLKAKIVALENKLGNYANNYKISTVEIDRQMTEQREDLVNELEKQVVELRGQIEDLRTAMVRLGSEVRRIKDSFSPSR
ncbi:MAG: hypothetical protein HY361_00715 [Candidatus Aenigmarchaeota archaeon]|nr:hypothetical protein [Candidatus Aenigmarchaeota archaeon]